LFATSAANCFARGGQPLVLEPRVADNRRSRSAIFSGNRSCRSAS
jgi:hypothetical protein